MSVGIGCLNPAFGSSRSASSAYQKWPTRRLAFHAQAPSQQAGLLNHLRPYTQVGWPICTSGPLRASTRASSGFALPRHSSPSFRYHRTRSCSTCLASASLHLHCAVEARGHLFTHACVRLLGLCFKMGRLGGRPRHRPRALFTGGHKPPSPPTLPSQTGAGCGAPPWKKGVRWRPNHLPDRGTQPRESTRPDRYD